MEGWNMVKEGKSRENRDSKSGENRGNKDNKAKEGKGIKIREYKGRESKSRDNKNNKNKNKEDTRIKSREYRGKESESKEYKSKENKRKQYQNKYGKTEKDETKENKGPLDHLNWYPGHMKKTREMIQENLKLVDAVIEVIDARIPVSSRNPIIDELIKDKKRVVLLNKADLADEVQTERWADLIKEQGHYAVAVNCNTGAGINNVIKRLDKIQDERNDEKARKRPLRLMIVGVPNAGKSSLINRLTGRKSTQTGDRPGVTRGKQWLTLTNGMQLLDTPGILWPKFEDPKVGINLAFCGSIRDEILDIETLCLEFIKILLADYKKLLMIRYKVDDLSEDALEAMEQIAIKRGFIFPGKRIDYERTARTVLDEFRGGQIGRITLERCQ